eukprot:TRINITY_DN18634_c1_g1_i7.p2 TRINITY_DN18634_c1_g1~~TRINITY_DN18634_c1_g1_i7.p2  ORF type:complete len:248 (+),score=-5.74 TRINITY_DN18634_c1_g1_i7:62-745(+)
MGNIATMGVAVLSKPFVPESLVRNELARKHTDKQADDSMQPQRTCVQGPIQHVDRQKHHQCAHDVVLQLPSLLETQDLRSLLSHKQSRTSNKSHMRSHRMHICNGRWPDTQRFASMSVYTLSTPCQALYAGRNRTSQASGRQQTCCPVSTEVTFVCYFGYSTRVNASPSCRLSLPVCCHTRPGRRLLVRGGQSMALTQTVLPLPEKSNGTTMSRARTIRTGPWSLLI